MIFEKMAAMRNQRGRDASRRETRERDDRVQNKKNVEASSAHRNLFDCNVNLIDSFQRSGISEEDPRV